MITAEPPRRIRELPVGSRVRLVGDPNAVTYSVAGIKDDGYYSLWYAGAEVVLASPDHLIEVKK